MADDLKPYCIFPPYPRSGYISRHVRRYGIAILKHFYTDEQTAFMAYECRRVAPSAPKVIDRPHLKTYRAYPEKFRSEFHGLFYNRELFRNVVQAYFREAFEFPAKCYITETYPDTDKKQLPYRPHFDDVHWLKFFLYLTDVRKHGGALEVVPGTHKNNRHFREAQIAEGVSYDTMDLTPKVGFGKKAIPILTDLGDLIIFDTDLSHHAGAGGERWAVQVLAASKQTIRWRNYEAEHDRVDSARKSKISGNVGAQGI